MEIRKVPISLLNAAPYNPRKDLQPGDPEYQKIARSIEKYGCVEPIIWNEKTGNVIGGHQRLKVLAATGAVEVDVSVVQLSLEDEKALNLALNKISGQWDNEKLSAVLQDLSAGFDVEVTGFDQHTLNAQKVYTNGHTLQVGAQFRDGFDGQIYTVKQELTHGPVHSMKRYMVEKKGESNPK